MVELEVELVDAGGGYCVVEHADVTVTVADGGMEVEEEVDVEEVVLVLFISVFVHVVVAVATGWPWMLFEVDARLPLVPGGDDGLNATKAATPMAMRMIMAIAIAAPVLNAVLFVMEKPEQKMAL